MEFKEFYQKYRRMCESYKNCKGCPRDYKGCPRDYKGCLDFGVELDELDELENDVEQWSKEHPQRTRLQDFQKKYPNASMGPYGTPTICCIDLGYCKNDCDLFKGNCVDCWNMPVEDE